jgi:superfamily II DNA/RNA helicase
VIDAATLEQPRRVRRPVTSDPLIVSLTGHVDYVSPGQRAAVQAAFLSEPGATLIINLPTGGGKTLAFQAPALAWSQFSGLTLVVVPTVALAKDQEARFRELLRHIDSARLTDLPPLAYHGGLDEEAKAAIRSAVKDGRVPILFASAEAAIGSLRGPLFDAARQGRLNVFAIDEAHIVTQWGQQFRPEFQSIAGLKQALLDACPQTHRFRTLLLTATLTPECCAALSELFGGGQQVEVISETALRPEPGFLVSAVASESERQAKVLEALLRLPRPLILYTTRRDHAEQWRDTLLTFGFRRLQMVRGGDLSDGAGDEVLRQWRDGAIDIVIGTSAFGLGVDQQDVRSVVHACLPETIDRYYQEVGRAGRDGNASVALIVSTPQDAETATNLSRERLISIDRGFERWEEMWVRHQRGQGDTYLVPLDARPKDIVEPGRRNASWNLRTLVLMGRAGLITFAAHPPPVVTRLSDESDEAYASRVDLKLAVFSQEVAIRIADPQHLDKAHWDRVVHDVRNALRQADEEALALVLELRDLKRPLSEILRHVYTLVDPPVAPPRVTGNCPVTRQRQTVSFASDPPLVTGLRRVGVRMAHTLETALRPSTDDAGRSWIAYTEMLHDSRAQRRQREHILSLLRFAVTGGIVELAVPDDFLGQRDWSLLLASSPTRFLIRAIDDDDLPSTAVARLTLLPGARAHRDIVRAMTVHRPRHILLVPRETRDPDNPNRGFLDVIRHLSLDDLLSRLQS